MSWAGGAGAAPAQEDAALSETVAKMQAVYDATRSLKGRFTQKVKSQFGKVQEASGRVIFAKPGKMRFDYESPAPRNFIADGKTLWIVEPTRKEVQKLAFETALMPAAVSFLWGDGKLTESFEIERMTQQRIPVVGNIELRLTPKKPSTHVKVLYFSVDPKSYRVTGMLVEDTVGGRNMFVFGDLEANVATRESDFAFAPPPGFQVLELGGGNGG